MDDRRDHRRASPDRLRPEFPLLVAHRRGPPPRLPRQRLDHAQAARRHRRRASATTSARTANVHRGVHALGQEATQLYDAARLEAASLVGAAPDEIVFVRGTTEAINLLAHGLALGPDDEVVFPASEHHANWLPWRVGRAPGAHAHRRRRRAAVGDASSRSSPRARGSSSIGHVSNVTGCIAPVARGRRARARPRHPGPARRGAVALAPAHRREEARRRLPRRQLAQGVRPERRRHPLRASASACSDFPSTRWAAAWSR